ncbi:MAG: hypothetical protein ACR2FN_08575 [Chitinophagaceae bacterium]
MKSTDAQQLFFNHIKGLLPSHLSLADEVADVLNISNDSAYRRIRGEKQLALEEIKKLCIHYHISLDQFLHMQTDSVIFTGKLAEFENFNFELYLQDFLHQMEVFDSFEQKELYYMTKDIPIFHHYNFPELAAFKYFFWMKTILNYPNYSKAIFNPGEIAEKLMKTGEKILLTYNKIPSTEIWSVENINSTIRQIEYYKDTNVFASNADVAKVYECLEKTIDHIESQADVGHKINQPGMNNAKSGAAYNVYVNEFSVGDNTVIPILNGKKMVYINHSHLNYSLTTDALFCDYIFNFFQNIIHKSTLISRVGEKERKQFFYRIREKIHKAKNVVF